MAANASIGPASRRFGALGTIIWAQVAGALLVVPAALILEGVPSLPSAADFAAVSMAAFGAGIGYIGLFEALRTGQIAVVTPITSVWCVLAVGFGVVFYDDPLTLTRAIGVGFVALGNATLAWSSARSHQPSPTVEATPDAIPTGTSRRAMALALLSALGFGILIPAADVAGAGVGRLWAVPMIWAVELAVGVPFLMLIGRLDPRPPSNVSEWLSVSRVGVFEGSGFVCVSLGLGVAPVSVVSPAASLATAFSVLYGVIVLHERLGPFGIGGAVVASAGVVLVSL